jgi:hypothetical protein
MHLQTLLILYSAFFALLSFSRLESSPAGSFSIRFMVLAHGFGAAGLSDQIMCEIY